MKYPGEIYEESERKLLKECVHTRNKHIELEERYEKLVSRSPSKIDLSVLQRALRKKDSIEVEVKPEEDEVLFIEEEPEVSEVLELSEASESSEEPEISEEAEVSEEPELEKEATFEEILELQKKIILRMSALNDEDFIKKFFDDEKTTGCEHYLIYNEPVLTKCVMVEKEPEDNEDQQETEEYKEEIVSVEVDEIIMPEKDGIGTVFAVPIENKAAGSEKQEVSMKKSAMGIVLAVAVLIIGALLIYSMWPV